MITLHHLNNSRSQRILWLLEELGVDYQIKRYERDPQTMLAPKELRDVHPLGKSPIVTDGDRTLVESGAIIEYLLDQYGKGRLRPAAGTDDRLLYNFYLHYAEGSVMSPLLISLVFSKTTQAPVPIFIRPIAAAIAAGVRAKFTGPQLKTHFDFIESELSRRPWFAGEAFSAADIQMSFPLEAAAVRLGFKERPHCARFLELIHARPAYKKALEVGGPFSMAF